ncbi:head-tail adaptor [Gemmobacter megaterium]|uniref:Head-tail adaptor n=1 Tax=Gemmobacter megaterium TaxID=1086013 RepID=A0A1N7LQH0_9RHOB|nr:head-tail adaptor protein [Gemmobacter megaterium]GGE11115.1 tail protein [Gemmobacter megaterium]SIS76097.1 head-tail adaptor [Gemmobacter megaterium]
MTALRLNRRMVLEARSEVADGAGGLVVSWVALGDLWAAVLPGAGREGGSEAVSLGEVALRITVRGAPEGAPSRPVAGQRLREGARLFRILAVAEADAAGRYLTCHAREEVAA